MLDIGRLMGSLVGESEQRTRQALRIIDAMAPCVAMLDEVEKALAGAGGGQGDSGVASRMFGTLLTWLNDRQSDVFVVCTCNDISKLPPEFARSERFDGVFFLDLPTAEQRQGDLGDLPPDVRPRSAAAASPGRQLDRRRDPQLLPAGGAARCAADGRGPERRAGGRHSGRVGRATAPVGQRPLPRCGKDGHLSAPNSKQKFSAPHQSKSA